MLLNFVVYRDLTKETLLTVSSILWLQLIMSIYNVHVTFDASTFIESECHDIVVMQCIQNCSPACIV